MLSIFAMMKSKNAISKLLLITALLFTVVFQFAHSLSHFSADITPISLEKVEKLAAQKDHHFKHISAAEHDSEKCFACDFFLSPFLQAESMDFQVLENTPIASLKMAIVTSLSQQSTFYFSLRAPPGLL